MTTRKAPRRRNAAEAPPSAGLRASARRDFMHVASRIFNTPLLIDPRKLEAIVAGLQDRIGVTIDLPQADFTREPMAFDPSWDEFNYEDYMTITDGVAVLHVDGTLVHKGSWLGTYSGLISYDGISEQLARVRARAETGEVRALLLNMHTHGGEVAGCFDLVDEIYAMRDVLPVYALVADAACSAGYALASAADEIAIAQAGYAGSIGVVYTHYDYTKYAEKLGVAVTHIYAGREKILGSPFKELSDEDREKLQAEIDDLYELFVAKVVRNRNMDADDVRDTEAAVFYANAGKSERDAIQRGLVDRVVSPREYLAEIQDRVKPGASLSRQLTEGDSGMAKAKPTGATGASAQIDEKAVQKAANTFMGSLMKALGIKKSASTSKAEDEDKDKEDDAAKKAEEDEEEEEEEMESDKAKNKAEEDEDEEDEEPGASALARADAILSCAEADGRSTLARHLAFKTKLSVAEARAILKQSPRGSSNPLAAAMEKEGTPGVTSEAPTTLQPVRINARSIYDARRKAAGHG